MEIQEIATATMNRLGNPVGHFPPDAVFKLASKFAQLFVSRFPTAAAADADTVHVQCSPLPQFEAKATDALAQLLALTIDHDVTVYCDNEGEAQRLRELIDQTMAAESAPKADLARLTTLIGLVHTGFIWQPSRLDRDCERGVPNQPRLALPDGRGSDFRPLAVVAHHELFRRYTQKRRIRAVTAGRPIESFLDLAEGDYVVHVVHGVGRYVGMRTMRKAGQTHQSEEFLTLRFADDAVVHVPVTQIDLVQKYIGARGARPTLSKLGTARWQATKEKVEEALTDLAGDLLRVQAARDSQEGTPFPQDTPWQLEFEEAFLYTPTPDQVTALRDIKNDMTRPRPMDRLLCGDVGYGKTELAMRAAFKVIEFGKQVAVLVPTTVLADQHYRTFRERMADYPFTIECLNRFRPDRQQKQIVQAARKGQIDILIGTHRILSKDVGFADLGLVIVDEEQRFGVEHKERLKALRTTVDVLTLSATPIPRTLHMAMISLRDISTLATPPMDRRAISTRVTTWSDEIIREALVRELNRDGQVFFVHNRVHSLQGIADRIHSLVPDARIIVGHGQMEGHELEEVMLKFIHREADILVCTTIIEAGLDIPNANTIFIDRADNFGLADLHQLRGRVGRYKHHAYCYLLLSPNRPITSTAARRLKAIEQFSELGAGFRIAMRDLEIRGAGNILGPEQSGNIAAIGYELYCQLLEQTVKRMRGEVSTKRVAVHLELNVEAYIPRSYMPSDRQRIECYRRFAACRTPQDVELLAKDLEDAFGRYPETVETMLTLADIRVRAAQWSIRSVIRKDPDVIFNIEGEIKKIEPLFSGSKGTVSVPDGRTLYWRLPENYFHGDTFLRILRNLFRKETQARPVVTSARNR
jgi:transcription-repair coupling factor (superfamily II helicase)